MSKEEIEVLLRLDGVKYRAIKLCTQKCYAIQFYECDNIQGEDYYYTAVVPIRDVQVEVQVIRPCKQHTHLYEKGHGWKPL